MYRAHITCILIFFLSCTLYAQSSTVHDSLKQEIKQSKGTERVHLLKKLGDKIRRSNPEQALQYLDEALELSLELENSELEAMIRNRRAYIHIVQDRHSGAMDDYHRALQIYISAGNKKGEASTLHYLGIYYEEQSDHSRALGYYFQSLGIREQLEGNPESVLHTLISIGTVYEKRKEWKQAIQYYNQALERSEEIENLHYKSIAATQAGVAYNAAGKTDQALQMFRKALDAADQLNSNHARAQILLNISSIYQHRQSYERAMTINRMEIEEARKQENPFLEAQGLENLAGIFQDMENLSEAAKYYQSALAAYNRIGIPGADIRLRRKLAQNYLEMENYNLAAEWGFDALNRARQKETLEPQRYLLELLVQITSNQNNSRKTVQLQNELLAVKDSLYNRTQSRQISEMQTKYETAQKEKEIEILKQEKQREALLRNAFLAGLILIGVIGILVYNRQKIKIRKNRTELENKRLKEEQLTKDLEFKNRELTNHSLHLVQKNEAMKDLKDNITEIQQNGHNDLGKELQKLANTVNYSLNLDEDWKQFQHYFEEVHSGFFDTLKNKYPGLTPNELRLSALAKLNLSIKETATILGITPNSVKTARYRLRKKLEMDTEENLTEFMMELEMNDLR